MAQSYAENGQNEVAYEIAKDVAAFYRNGIYGIHDPVALSILASIFRRSGDEDTAYEFLLRALNNANTEVFSQRYYPAVYGEPIVGSEISPLMIRGQYKLLSTQSDWEWLTDESQRRGDLQRANEIRIWLENINGIAR